MCVSLLVLCLHVCRPTCTLSAIRKFFQVCVLAEPVVNDNWMSISISGCQLYWPIILLVFRHTVIVVDSFWALFGDLSFAC